MPPYSHYDYDLIKKLAKKRGCRVDDLIVLTKQNDPFYATGLPACRAQAEWFADLWQRFEFTYGVHLRRIHYQLSSGLLIISQHNGKLYENTENCWQYLLQASKIARYLELVDPDAFDDRNNPDPVIHEYSKPIPSEITVNRDVLSWSFSMPSLPEPPTYELTDYEGQQLYHLEVWCEKTTMNDVLLPLCEKYHANLVTGAGELSAIRTKELFNRINNKPVRIFYLSDFDPAGQCMPVSVARKLEFFIRKNHVRADVKLIPVVLSLEQVVEYQLPRIPIKESERRAGAFEDRFGEGAVELDALEAAHPGALQSIMCSWLDRYFDDGLDGRVNAGKSDLFKEMNEVRNECLEQYHEQLDELASQYNELVEEVGPQVAEIRSKIDRVHEEIERDLDDNMPEVGDIPEAEEADEPGEVLFDAKRNYETQLVSYKEFQGKL